MRHPRRRLLIPPITSNIPFHGKGDPGNKLPAGSGLGAAGLVRRREFHGWVIVDGGPGGWWRVLAEFGKGRRHRTDTQNAGRDWVESAAGG